jgi:CheY-like chemotaxis protein
MASQLPRSILVAEDNPTNRRVATVMLKQLGYDPVVVENGAKAVQAAQKQGFDLVFMDIHMPVMDGIEATRKIRNLLPANAQPWIVALTAGVNSQMRAKANNAGINEFVTKPFMVESLRAAIEHSEAKTPTTSTPATPSKHFEQLKALYASSPEEFRDLVDQHLRSVELLLRDIDRAIDASDAEGLALAAHSLKASSRMFGHMQMGEVAESIETLAEEDDLDTAARHVLLLHAHWEQARTNLEQERDDFTGA